VKVAIICDSLLLKRSLEKFLKDMVVPYKNCDIVITDRKIKIDKPIILVGHDGDIKVPFSKSNLLMELEKFYFEKQKEPDIAPKPHESSDLYKKLEPIIQNFAKELITVIKNHYETQK
jgi:hypothetical protein